MDSGDGAASTAHDTLADHDPAADEAAANADHSRGERPRTAQYCAILQDTASGEIIKLREYYKEDIVKRLKGVGDKRVIELYYGRSFEPETRITFRG